MRRLAPGTLAALLVLSLSSLSTLAGCAPTLRFNQTWLSSEELKLARNGYVSLKSTGESIDLAPIKAQETGTGERIVILKVHGSYLIVGDSFKHAWRLWAGGKDEAHYEPVDSVKPGAQGFTSPTLEVSGNCALVRWQRGSVPAQAFVTFKGDVDEKKCGDE
jgi:hypothetical protein